MSALSRIRNNIGLVAVVIFVALAAFILTDFLSGITSIFNTPPPAAVVAGEEITNQEFEQRVSEAMQQYQGAAYNDAFNGQIRDNVWSQIVQEKVFDQEFDKVGLIITDDELIDMMAGNHIPPSVISGFFGQDPNNPNMAFIRQGLKQLKESPNGLAALKSLEDFLLRSRPQERYSNMIRRSFVGSNLMAQKQYNDQNKTVDISYLSIPYSSIIDSTINVSTSEIDNYISDNAARFEQDEEAYVRYVNFDVNPSAEDSASARNRIAKIITSFSNAGNDSIYTRGRVRAPYSNTFKAISNIPAAIQDMVLDAEDKKVFGPIQDGAYYKLYKLVGTETADKPSAAIDHILITAGGTTAADTAEARTKASNIARQARSGSDFAELALENSNDPSTKNIGGKLGWYNKARFDEDFNSAIEGASVGSIVGPLKGPGGFHVVKITNKTDKSFNIAEIEEEITPSSATKKQVYLAANQFVKKAKDNGDLNAAAIENGTSARETAGLSAKTYNIPGLNGGRNLAVWALNSDIGEISSVLKINQDEKYVVAQVVRKYDEGLKSSAEVTTRELVRREVRNDKKAAQIKNLLGDINGKDLNSLKTAYGASAVVSTANGISFESNSVPGMGAEPLVIGTALGLAEGGTKLVQGENGIYVIQVTKINEPAAPDATALAGIKSSAAQQGGFGIQNKIGPGLVDIADVKDTRADYEWLVQRQTSRN